MQKNIALALCLFLAACKGESSANSLQAPDALAQSSDASSVMASTEDEADIYRLFSDAPGKICSRPEVLTEVYNVISTPYRHKSNDVAQIALSVHNEGVFTVDGILLNSHDATSRKIECEADIKFSHNFINRNIENNVSVNYVVQKWRYSVQPTVNNDKFKVEVYSINSDETFYREIFNISNYIIDNEPYIEIRRRTSQE